jgi:23S rRNA (pseudouridine1915-N3)-methyltransferase
MGGGRESGAAADHGTMRITIAAVGTRLPGWVYDGVEIYSQRLPRQIRLDLAEIPAGNRSGKATAAIEEESRQLLKRADQADLTIALDERGKALASTELATEMRGWLDHVPHVAILIGGPDGLSDACRDKANSVWSLSRLTLPHGLVRVVLVEQLYRAWTIVNGHPYHRS